jgi:heme/copper-type cytochrome/quinol oxidase subunit 2
LKSVKGLKSKWFFGAAVLTIFFVAFVTTQVLEAEAAIPRNFTLYGSFQSGWGFTANNITSPGPTIVVEQGDNVSLTLISNDGITHLFFVSYTNATNIVAGDPQSPGFSATVNYSFIATNTVGTYTYRCYFHPTVMWGYFRVVPTGTIPEFQPLAMLSLSIVSIGIAALARKRRRQV